LSILVTGAGGFIGSNLLDVLPDDTIALTRTCIKGSSGRLISKSIDSESDFSDCFSSGVETVVHLASVAHNKSNDIDNIDNVNVKGTINLALQALKFGVKRFIFISSIGVLGNKSNAPFNEDTRVSPYSAYTFSKLKAEEALLKLVENTEMEVVIIRPVLVYGVKAPGNFSKLKSLIEKFPFLPFGMTNNQRSFISVANLASFIELCIDHPDAKNEIFCISDGVDVSIKEFTNSISTGLSKKTFQLPIPSWVIRYVGKVLGKTEMVDQLIGDLQVDIGKAKSLLGWVPVETMDQAMNKLR